MLAHDKTNALIGTYHPTSYPHFCSQLAAVPRDTGRDRPLFFSAASVHSANNPARRSLMYAWAVSVVSVFVLPIIHACILFMRSSLFRIQSRS